MPDAVDSLVLLNDGRNYHALFTNNSDGSGESDVAKIDISGLTHADGGAPLAVDICELSWACSGMSVLVEWEHDTDDAVWIAADSGCVHFDPPAKDPRSAGGTGDLVFTTIGHTSGDTYSILVKAKLRRNPAE